jgi:hypothetical protein
MHQNHEQTGISYIGDFFGEPDGDWRTLDYFVSVIIHHTIGRFPLRPAFYASSILIAVLIYQNSSGSEVWLALFAPVYSALFLAILWMAVFFLKFGGLIATEVTEALFKLNGKKPNMLHQLVAFAVSLITVPIIFAVVGSGDPDTVPFIP